MAPPLPTAWLRSDHPGTMGVMDAPPPPPPPLPDAATRLRELVDAGIRITAEHSLEGVLQAVADAARQVIGAEYAALGVLDVTGTELARFVSSGFSADTLKAIEHPPSGKGILGLLISDPHPIRLQDLTAHPRAAGFPAHHPTMHSFLGVPISSRAGPVGNLYLAEKLGRPDFTDADEAVAIMLAAQAAVAVENATLYEKSQRLVHEVKSIQAARDRFYAMINHELRNALTAVYGWADLLLRKTGPDGPRAAIEVYESAERTLALLNDLLDLSRLEAERLRPSVRETDAGTLVGEAVKSVEPGADHRGITLAVEGLDGSAACQTDPHRVRQILINLLSNAVRHSPEGDTVTVRVDVSDRRMRFDVVDHGPGIAAEEQVRIFEAFARAASDERGTGLGLTLSKQLALLLGGDLTVESREGAGARFTLDVPRWFGRP